MLTAESNHQSGFYKAAINRSYYAIFHSIRAVNLLDGFDASKHSSVIAHFNQFFVHTGKFDKNIYKLIDSAYRIRENGSQQAFTDSFKAMYKVSPAEFRKTKEFYPLQLEIHLREGLTKTGFTKNSITFATPADVDSWMELVNLTVDGYPCLDRAGYMAKLHQYIADKRALILRDACLAIGVMGFSPSTGSIDFWAVHPQYRHLGITELFLDKLVEELPYGKEITITTYRAGDKADTGYREEYCRLGFAERELLVEYGYPAQRFVLLPEHKEGARNGRNTEEPISRTLSCIISN